MEVLGLDNWINLKEVYQSGLEKDKKKYFSRSTIDNISWWQGQNECIV